MREHTADCDSWVDERSCDCGADAHNKSLAAPLTLQSIVQTHSGLMALDMHGRAYWMESTTSYGHYTLIPLTLTVKEP